jgi:hypothetical protein
MRLATLFFVYKDRDTPDDKVMIDRELPLVRGGAYRYSVSLKAHDQVSTYTIYLQKEQLMNYVETLIKGLENDNDPFESVQVSSAVFPSFIFRMDEHPRWEARDALRSLLATTIESHVTRTE